MHIASNATFYRGFNTQPPEGGWRITASRTVNQCGFNTQPPEGGWINPAYGFDQRTVSTHSRLKAAGNGVSCRFTVFRVSTHSRLKAAGNEPA